MRALRAQAVSTISGGVELELPEERFVSQYDLKVSSLNAAAADMQASEDMERCITDWCKATEDLLAQVGVRESRMSGACVHACMHVVARR
jgi:hypothetical protein